MSRSPAGFEEFARASARSLSGRAYLLCHDHHLAEDLVQETLARRYVRWRHIDDVESPAGYARAALTNAYIDRTRRRSHHEPPLAEVADTGVPDQVDGVPRRVTLRRVVGVSRCGRAPTGHFASDGGGLAVPACPDGSLCVGRTPAWSGVACGPAPTGHLTSDGRGLAVQGCPDGSLHVG